MKRIGMILAVVLFAGVLAAAGYAPANIFVPTEVKTYPAQIEPGDESVLLELMLINRWSQQYENITSELLVTDPFTGVETTDFISRLGPGERANVFYRIDVDEDAHPGQYMVTHKLTYNYVDYNEDNAAASRNVVEITTINTLAIDVYYTQRLEIAEMRQVPDTILPGEKATLEVYVKNTGGMVVNDIDVSYNITTDSMVVNLAPIDTTKKRVYSIAPGGEEVVSFGLRALELATVQAYKIEVVIAYANGTDSDFTFFNLLGKPGMRLAGVQTDRDTVYAGVPFSLSVQLENIGSGDAKSVKMELQDTALDGVLTSYVGTVDVDDTGSAIFDITDRMPGRKMSTALITYEDDYGNIFTDSIEVEYFVTAVPANYSWVFMVLGVVLVGGFLFYRHQKRKKEMALVK